MPDAATMQAKIEKLLAKAERTDNPHEAEAFSRKAEQLMVEWGITEAMLSATRKATGPEKIVDGKMQFTGGYAKAMVLFGGTIGQALGLRVYESRMRGESKVRKLHIVGHESDVARAHMLITSLHLQANTALRVWWRDFPLKEWLTQAEKFRARRQFLIEFANACGARLLTARREAEAAEQARTDAATGTGTTGPSVALVLADRGRAVDTWMRENVGRMGRGRGMAGSEFGGDAGRAAGRKASLGQPSSVRGGSVAAIG